MLAISTSWIAPLVYIVALAAAVWFAYLRPHRTRARPKTGFEESIRGDLESRSPRFPSGHGPA